MRKGGRRKRTMEEQKRGERRSLQEESRDAG